jgi:predicted transcriptional regulator of viral defense system
MKFDDLLAIVGNEPVFEPGQLQPGNTAPAQLQRELTRWVKSGRLHELRRGLYALAPPFRKISPHPFLVANRIVPGSYVSLQSALAHYGLIPEHVAVTTSVTAGSPGTWDTPIGRYHFRPIRPDLLTGFQRTAVGEGREALLATREKALLDLIHLELGAESPEVLQALRLQHLDHLDLGELRRQAAAMEAMGEPQMVRAAEWIVQLARTQIEEYELF